MSDGYIRENASHGAFSGLLNDTIFDHTEQCHAIRSKTILQNITSDQLLAIGEVAKRITNGHINPLRRDVQLFERRRLLLKTLASPRVSNDRKKRLVQRYHSLVPSVLKSVYLIQTIVDEVITTIEA